MQVQCFLGSLKRTLKIQSDTEFSRLSAIGLTSKEIMGKTFQSLAIRCTVCRSVYSALTFEMANLEPGKFRAKGILFIFIQI